MTRPDRVLRLLGLLAVLAAVPVISTAQLSSPRGVVRTLFWENTNVGNAADANYVKTATYVLPAGTLARDGDRLVVEADFLLSSAAGNHTYVCNVGWTSFAAATQFAGGVAIVVNASAVVSVSVHATGYATRLSAGTAIGGQGISFVGAAWQGIVWLSSALTAANAQNVACAINSTAVSANSSIIEEFRVRIEPR